MEFDLLQLLDEKDGELNGISFVEISKIFAMKDVFFIETGLTEFSNLLDVTTKLIPVYPSCMAASDHFVLSSLA